MLSAGRIAVGGTFSAIQVRLRQKECTRDAYTVNYSVIEPLRELMGVLEYHAMSQRARRSTAEEVEREQTQ